MADELTLDEIGHRFGTDKSSGQHDYLNFYESFFAPNRHKPITILEVGIFSGASLRTWEVYFSKAKIIGADIELATKKFEHGRVRVEILDQSNIEELTRLALKHGPFDIIIEDGSHMWDHQITSLRTLFPFVKDGGLYIVEDLQTNYGSMVEGYRGIASISCVEYLKRWLDLRVGDDQIDITTTEDAFLRTYGRAAQFITFYRRACLIRKIAAAPIRAPSPGEPVTQEAEFAGSEPLVIRAHVSNIGDVIGTENFINLRPGDFPLQGLAIGHDEDILQYRVKFPNHTWSGWASTNQFVGTVGQGILLNGIAVRLQDHAKTRFRLNTISRFASGSVARAADGQDCTDPAGTELCGLQLGLTRL